MTFEAPVADAGRLVLFGATGDLARRMLWPSLYALDLDGLLPRDFRIVGAAHSRWSPEQFQAKVRAAIASAFDESRVYRIDHYLGKEAVQNLLALRFGNSIFEPLWNAHNIEHVQITVAETVGVEGRWGYYDTTGALRDMVQSHVLQL